MKTYSLILFIIFNLILSNVAFSQDGEIVLKESRFMPYSVGGLNWASITGVENKSEVSPFATFNVGLGFLGIINKPGTLGITVEGVFSQQGFKLNEAKEAKDPQFMKVNYINVPAVLRFGFSKSSNFYFGLGPQVGFVVGGHALTVDGSNYTFKDGALNNTAFDAIGILGSYFGDNGDMGLEVRYQYGLNKFMIDAPQYRHNLFQVRLIMPLFFLEMLGGPGI